jgi:hypothetical protein
VSSDEDEGGNNARILRGGMAEGVVTGMTPFLLIMWPAGSMRDGRKGLPAT